MGHFLLGSIKWGVRLITNLHITSTRICGAMPPIPCTISWHVQGQLYLRFRIHVLTRQNPLSLFTAIDRDMAFGLFLTNNTRVKVGCNEITPYIDQLNRISYQIMLPMCATDLLLATLIPTARSLLCYERQTSYTYLCQVMPRYSNCQPCPVQRSEVSTQRILSLCRKHSTGQVYEQDDLWA
jgi:hypothetical protein